MKLYTVDEHGQRIECDDAELVPITLTHGASTHMWWENNGECWETMNDGPATRRPDLDWGTPTGDLLIAPWLQDVLRENKGEKDH